MQPKPYFIVGIPTRNEAKTIASLVKSIDKGLRKYSETYTTIIINADNNSPDKTKDVFNGTKTVSQKLYIPSGRTRIGKGTNVYNLLLVAARLRAEILILFDGDIQNFSTQWIDKFTEQIQKGYDFVTPIYSRKEYDGSITNHVCRPLLGFFFGVDIKQPIGGDFALSQKFVRHLLHKKQTQTITHYGIDIYLTINALLYKFRMKQVILGRKIHNPSLPKLEKMFAEVMDTLLRTYKASNKHALPKRFRPLKTDIPLLPASQRERQTTCTYLTDRATYLYRRYYKSLHGFLDKKTLRTIQENYHGKTSATVSDDVWREILRALIVKYPTKDESKNRNIMAVCVSIFFTRHATFINELRDKKILDFEQYIARQVRQLSLKI